MRTVQQRFTVRIHRAVLPAATWIRLVIWLALGFAIYSFYGARRARLVREGRIIPVAATVEVP